MTGATPVDWKDEHTPRSPVYGDIYFSAEDGLAETRAVFLTGCGLPEAWSGRRRFVVGELGFGTGLNIAALLELWSRSRPADAHLNVFSVEAHPLSREDAARALATWPELDGVTSLLLSRWPGVRPGVQRIELPEHHATIDLFIGDVAEALSQWQGRADAWFLDGFSPALNPQMWREEIMAAMAARSAPGARAATFTVAGHVRRALAAAGFEVTRAPGFGRKRERLEATLPGAAHETDPGRTVIMGGGVAAAMLARAFTRLGQGVTLITGDRSQAASGNPAALVTPALDAGGGPRAQFFAQAFARATQIYRETPDAMIAKGVMQLEAESRDAARFDGICKQPFFEPGSLKRLTRDQTSAWLGEAVERGGLEFTDGLVIEPEAIVGPLLAEAMSATVARIEPGPPWRLTLSDGGHLEADTVILAAGWQSMDLWPSLPLSAVRGQASWARGADAPSPSALGAYIVPTRDGVLFGATFDRGDTSTETRAEDHQRNLELVGATAPRLAARLSGSELEGRAAVRATTRDRMPLAGALTAGLFVLSGLGSRGFTSAPLLAEHIAALVCATPSPLPAALSAVVAPDRAALWPKS